MSARADVDEAVTEDNRSIIDDLGHFVGLEILVSAVGRDELGLIVIGHCISP